MKEADDSPDYAHIMPLLPLPQVFETQDNLEEPKGDEENIMIDLAM